MAETVFINCPFPCVSDQATGPDPAQRILRTLYVIFSDPTPAGIRYGPAGQLAREYDVSRATAQKALRVLRDEGTVQTRARWGTFVAERP